MSKLHESAHPGRLTAVAILAVLVLVAASCGSSSPAARSGGSVDDGTPRSGGALVVGIRAESNGWNPAVDQWADTGSLEGSTMLEPLATQGEDNGAKPWLAASWYPNETFDKWIINLQPDVLFQDGEPFNADAVVQNIRTYSTSPISSVFIGSMFEDVKAVGALQVEIDLTQSWAAFPSSYLQGGYSYMMAPRMLADHESTPIGTGPFTYDTWQSGGSLEVRRNPTYWGGLDADGNRRSEPALLDSIEFRVITDDASRTAALESGDIDMEFTTSASDAARLSEDYTQVRDWSTESAFIMTNTAPTVGGRFNPLSNIHARRALAYATDREQLATEVGTDVQVPTSPWSPDSPWGMPADQNGYVDHDQQQAEAEIAAYEAETGESSLHVTLSGAPGVDDLRILQTLQSQWEAAGIQSDLESLEQAASITKLVTGGMQAAFVRNYGYPDPDQVHTFLSKDSISAAPGGVSLNYTQYTTPEIERDLALGRTSGFPDQRKAAYDDLVKQINAGLINIWLFSTPYSFIAEKRVHGLDAPGGPGQIKFGNYGPKTWWSSVWLAT